MTQHYAVAYRHILAELGDYFEAIYRELGLEEDMVINVLLGYWNTQLSDDPPPLSHMDVEGLRTYACDWILLNIPQHLYYRDPDQALAAFYEGLENLYREFHPVLYHLYRDITPTPRLVFIEDRHDPRGYSGRLFHHLGQILLTHTTRSH